MTRTTAAGLSAAAIAALGWCALSVDFAMSVPTSLARGEPLLEALYMHFRYFTIITNVGIAVLMTLTARRAARGAPFPATAFYNAAVVYGLVTCVTYEALLRRLWSPTGVQFVTDLVMHDIVPPLLLLFWLAFAPRRNARWRDALWMLAYPTAYFAATLVAGALGAGYPYGFLDASKLGYPAVMIVAAIFLATFFLLGLTTTGFARHRQITDDRSPTV